MDESLRHELFFLIAKLLKSEFPQIGEAFINECENSKKFPSLVFNAHPSFEQLEKTSLPDIPNDQLVRLIQLACPHSEYPSLLFNASQTLSKPSLASCLSAHIIPNISPIYKISPKIRVIGHSSEVYCLAFDITNQLLITGSDDYKVKVWNFQTCTLMSVFFHHSNVISDIQVHPTNDFFAISSHDFTISIISLKNLSLIHLIQLESEVHSIRFSPCGTFLAAALEEGSIRIFHVHNFEEYCAIPTPNRLAAAWLSFSPGGEFLIFSADPHDLVILSLKSLQYKTLVGHEELPEYVTFSKNSCNLILTCSYKEKNVRLWTRINSCWESTGILTLRVNNHKVKVIRACFNCDDSNIVAISANSLFCFDTQTKRLIKNSTFSPSSTFSSNTNPTPGSNNGFMNDVDDFAFLDHCCVLAMHPTIPNIAFVGCATGRCAIWDTHRCEIVSKLCHEETTKITEAVWSNDGFSVVSGDARGGFTVFTYHHRPFITIDQFFFSEFSNGNLNSLRINSNSQQNTRNNENNFSNEENQNAEENEHSDIDDITDNQRNQQQNENDGNSSVIEDRNIESNNQEMYLMNNLNHNSQFNNNIDFEIDENTITDSQAQPLIPQPEKTDISKLRLGIRAPILNDQQVIEEETIVEFWKTDNVQVSKSFESLNGEEEEEQNNVNDDKPVTSSRMSTRHSISIFDEKFDDISVNRSHIRTRNHRENRLERRLSTRNDSDRFGINNQDNIDLINEEDGIISDNGESDEEYDLTNNRRARSIDDYYDDNEYDENEYGYDHEYDYEYNIVYEEEDEEEENEYKEEELVTETETNVSITGRKMVTRRAFSPEPIKHRKRIQTRRGGRGRGNRQTRNSLSSRDEEDSRNQNENASPSLPRRKSRISDFQLFSSDSDDQALLKPSGMATRTRNKTSTAQQVQSNSHSSSTSTKKKPGRKPQTKNLEKVNEKPVVTVTGRRSIKGNSFSPPPPRKVKRRVKEIQQKTSSRRELSPPKPLKHLTDRTINDSSSKSTSRRRISPPPPHKQPLKQQSKRSRIIPDKSQNIESSNSKINLHSISRIKTRSSTTEPFDEEFPLFYHRKPRKSLQNAQKNPSKTQENNGQFKNKDEIENNLSINTSIEQVFYNKR
ncbi:hypothetical protein TRFO_15881 [Tritrichomonas foetus]|uniref:Anaphase-promoting complex subunit 4-like WD40 domain-containing protein n=1 Tax=Tritrichomonas foetus TaxID=1144522 RepID=A0A1J4KWF4_9EUKA|nr:hypothetical protein TRFO_15881 [Tritrichomonas foetus]|eukprot:OHT13861.1 hypothetical protein TRFO_15881 [Tritrichomonas foetus]